MASSMLSLLATGLFIGSAAAAAQCSSYTVDTDGAIYSFQNYKFMDFRNVDTSYLSSAEFTGAYRPQTWGNGKFQNTANNIAINTDTVNGTKTSMLSLYARNDGGSVTAAELDSTIDDYYYASVRMGVRVTGAAGACAGLFYYHSDTQETDIEILTREQATHLDAESMQSSPPTTAQIHLTNQPHLTKTVDITPLSNLIAGQSNVAVPATVGTWEQFNNYRIDWIPGLTKWWQNGNMSHTADKNLIENPSSWIFNIWSNGDPSWSGTMAPNTVARMDILWVEMAYNRQADGVPQVVGVGKRGCTLGLGDGTNLANPSSTTPTTNNNIATPADNAVVPPVTHVAKRAPVKFVA